MLKNDALSLPESQPICGAGAASIPYVFVGDEAFPLRHNLMRPYPGRNLNLDKRIYNYRLSRARRTVENAFGIMASRFRLFHCPLMVHPKNVTLVTKGALVLHNFLRNEVGVQYVDESTADYEDATGTLRPGDWRKVSTNQLHSMRPAGVRGSNDATRIRDQFKNYFSSEIGSVSWQNAKVTATH